MQTIGNLYYLRGNGNGDYDHELACADIALREAKKKVAESNAMVAHINFMNGIYQIPSGIWMFKVQGKGWRRL